MNPFTVIDPGMIPRSGGWYQGITIRTAGVGAGVALRCYYSPIYVFEPFMVQALGIGVTTGVAGTAIMGVYASLRQAPTNLIYASGTVDVTSIATLTIAVSPQFMLGRGLYFAAVVATSTAAIARCASSPLTNFGFANATANSSPIFGYTQNLGSLVLPTQASGLTVQTGSLPYVAIQAA